MAQVPYSPVPDVQEQLQPTPELHVNTPGATFGEDVGKAIETLGNTTQNVSSEIFARAQAMQGLKNETDTRRASVNTLQSISDATEKFKTQYGENAGPEQYQQFMKDVADVREKGRALLTNPDAQKMYDAETFRYVGNAIMAGGNHAAQQLKATTTIVNKAQQQAHIDAIANDPENVKSVKDNIDAAVVGKLQELHDAGISDTTTVNEEVSKVRSAGAVKQVTTLIDQGKVEQARAILNNYNKDNIIRDPGPLQKELNAQEATLGSKHIVGGLQSGNNITLGQKIVPIERMKDAISNGIESRGWADPYAAEGPDVNGDHAYGKYQVMGASLPGFLKQAGLGPMTPQQFLKDHDAQEKVFEAVFGGYMQKYGSANAASVAWFAGEGALVKSADGTWGPKAGWGGDGHTSVAGYLAAVNKQLYKNTPQTERITTAQGLVKQQSPDNTLWPDAVENQIRISDTHQTQMERAAEHERFDGVYKALQEQKGQGGFDMATLMQNPNFAKAVKGMSDEDRFKKLPMILRAAANEDDEVTDQRKLNYQHLIGMGYTQPEKFKDVEPYSVDLRAAERKDIIRKLAQVRAGKVLDDDPAISKVLADSTVKQAMAFAGVEKTNLGMTEYNRFTGALADEINQARVSGTKAISHADTVEIAQRLLQDRVVGQNWFGVDQKQKQYAVTPPEDWILKNKPVAERMLKHPPSDDELQRLYSRKVYQDTFNKKAEK